MAEDSVNFVEFGLAADQRGSDVDDGVAAVVNPALRPFSNVAPAMYPRNTRSTSAIQSLFGRPVTCSAVREGGVSLGELLEDGVGDDRRAEQ